MKRLVLIVLLCFLLSSLLVGWVWAQGEQEDQTQVEAEAETEEAPVEEPAKPYRDWGDYRYTFNSIAPSSDLDPQSVIINWFSPSLYYANWERANYVHLYITVEWLNNDRSLDYMPLQLVLHSGGRTFILFGKGCSNQSYLWRGGSQYPNDLGARYPDYIGGNTRLFFTFDTNGARIDPNSAYVEVQGMLQVWDWSRNSQLYVTKNLSDVGQGMHGWVRFGSSYFTYTPLGNIPLTEILPSQ
jgi:hypothetical protein